VNSKTQGEQMSSEDAIGKRIRDCRESKKISQSELAKLVGLSPAAIWNWESKGRVPRRKTLAKVADALKVSQEFLAEGNEAKDTLSSEISSDGARGDVARIHIDPPADTIAHELERARARIAELAGFELSRIKLKLTFGD
jgi:transcriptional regulator with XRE-family HTH domain